MYCICSKKIIPSKSLLCPNCIVHKEQYCNHVFSKLVDANTIEIFDEFKLDPQCFRSSIPQLYNSNTKIETTGRTMEIIIDNLKPLQYSIPRVYNITDSLMLWVLGERLVLTTSQRFYTLLDVVKSVRARVLLSVDWQYDRYKLEAITVSGNCFQIQSSYVQPTLEELSCEEQEKSSSLLRVLKAEKKVVLPRRKTNNRIY